MTDQKATGIRKINAVDLSKLNLRSKSKRKKTKSLYDSEISDRSYWGNDPGTDIEIALTRIEIRKSLKDGKMLDIKNFSKASHLSKDLIMELAAYQFHFMTIIAEENDCNIFENINGDGFVMVDFQNDKYEFIFVK